MGCIWAAAIRTISCGHQGFRAFRIILASLGQLSLLGALLGLSDPPKKIVLPQTRNQKP